MLVVGRPRTLCVRMLARRVSFCVEARTPAWRERLGHLVLLSSVSICLVWMRGLPHIAENFKIENLKYIF